MCAQHFFHKVDPYHVTRVDVSAPLQRLEVENITGQKTVRGRGGVISLLYKTKWNSPNHAGSGIWTSTSHAPTFSVVGPALRTSTAKLTAVTTGCALALHGVCFPRATANVFHHPPTLASHGRSGFAATATRCSPRELQGQRWVVVAGENKPKYDGGWGVARLLLRQLGVDQDSCPSDVPHDLGGGFKRILVSPGPRSQRVPSADKT